MGLFGGMKLPPMPGLISGYGGGTFNMDGTQATPMESAMAIPTGFGQRPDGIEQAAAYAGPVKKGGLFGSGVKLQQIAGILGDALMNANGGGMPYTQMQMQQRQYDRALQQNALQQQQELARQMALKQWERSNPAPTEAQRNFEAYQQMGPAERALYDRMRAGDPYVTTTLPNKQIYSGPASGLGSALGGGGVSSDDQPGEEDGYIYTPGPGGRGNQANWKPKGGPSGNVGGNFLPGR